MATLLQSLFLLSSLWSLAYWRLEKWVWIPAFTVLLLGFSLYSQVSWFLLGPVWLVYLTAMVGFAFRHQRLRLVSALF